MLLQAGLHRKKQLNYNAVSRPVTAAAQDKASPYLLPSPPPVFCYPGHELTSLAHEDIWVLDLRGKVMKTCQVPHVHMYQKLHSALLMHDLILAPKQPCRGGPSDWSLWLEEGHRVYSMFPIVEKVLKYTKSILKRHIFTLARNNHY